MKDFGKQPPQKQNRKRIILVKSCKDVSSIVLNSTFSISLGLPRSLGAPLPHLLQEFHPTAVVASLTESMTGVSPVVITSAVKRVNHDFRPQDFAADGDLQS